MEEEKELKKKCEKEKKKVLSKFTERRKKESKEERFPQDLLISR